MKVPKIKTSIQDGISGMPYPVTTHMHNHVAENQLQPDMQSRTVPGLKPQQEVITTCSYTMSK